MTSSSNLFEVFRERFGVDPARIFIIRPDGRTFTYADLVEISGRMTTLLQSLGLQPGDRVAVQVEKSAEAVFLYLACLRAGVVFLPLNTAYRRDELDYFLSDAEPSLVVGDPAAAALWEASRAANVTHRLTLSREGTGTLTERAAALPPIAASVTRTRDDLAAILYSSGTTGRPKGVMLSHGNLAANARALREVWNFTAGDTLLHTLPIFHVHGLFISMNTVLISGAGMIFHERFAADEAIRDLPCASVFMGVPTYYVRLAAHSALTREACRSIRLFLCGSAPLLDDTARAFEARTGHKIVERYGMTESGIITSARVDKPRTAGAVGWPLPGVSLRVVDDTNAEVAPEATGQIQIKGDGVFRGYWRKPEKTAEDFTADGFFKTGDLATRDATGMVHIVGRAKDMMISGGYNVYPKEIETVIDALPGVAESAVVGMPHPDFGEAGLAVVTTAAGAKAPSADGVRQALAEKLANYKVPKLVVFAEALPRNTMGKVQKNLLRQEYRAAWDAHIGAAK